MRRMLVAGNWKMNGTGADLETIGLIADAARGFDAVDTALCLPATLIERAARRQPGMAIGGQDVHAEQKGAHTGCISVAMLRDAGFGEIRVTGFADSSIWDVFRAAGPLGQVSHFARTHLPAFANLRFMQDVWPNLFAKHLRATARKPG